MHAKTAEEVMYLIRTFEYSTNPVTLISIEASTGADVVEELTWHGGTYQVVFHGGEPTSRMLTLVSQYNWDKPSMDNRTAEIIMVLKGRHNLLDEAPSDIPDLGPYLQDVALYLSDDCFVPFRFYERSQGAIDSVIKEVVLDYLKCCNNPSGFVWQYFEYKKTHCDNYNDTQCWCAALAFAQVKKNGQYINKFNRQNTQPYHRKHQFFDK